MFVFVVVQESVTTLFLRVNAANNNRLHFTPTPPLNSHRVARSSVMDARSRSCLSQHLSVVTLATFKKLFKILLVKFERLHKGFY